MKPIFQFSSFEDKTYINKLTEAIRRLGGKCDDSKIYSPKATHLIVEKMECTEKILCFIASGKWIVTHSYLKHSLQEKKFLDEETFHVSKRFKESKLANVSLKWKENITEKKTNAPFFNWNVGCLIKDEEKAKALIRIIKAGYGSASAINRKSNRIMPKYTLIIYDKSNKETAKTLAQYSNICYYPFESIPDYMVQCIISDSPILPMSYYENLENPNGRDIDMFNVSMNKINDIEEELVRNKNLKISISVDKEFSISNSYKTILLCANMSERTEKTINQEIENQFFVLWDNNAFNEAINIVASLNDNEIPTVRMLNVFFSFLTEKKIKAKSGFSYESMDDITYDTIYNTIYSYILNLILNQPPTSKRLIKLYSDVFESLEIKQKIWNSDLCNFKGIIDTLYLMSVYDYLLFNSNDSKIDAKKICSLPRYELEKNDVLLKVIDLMLKDKLLTTQMLHKMLEIISFCNRYFQKNSSYQKIYKFVSKLSGDECTSDLEELFLCIGKK